MTPLKNNKLKNVLFIGDKSHWSLEASQTLKLYSNNYKSLLWEYGEEKPKELSKWKGDWIFSFKSDLVLPAEVLRNYKFGKINIHPSPPKYRGIGGYTYAVLNNDSSFGVTAHHIVDRIDFGEIIKVIRFPMIKNETSDLLERRTAVYSLVLFYEIISILINGNSLPSSDEIWGSKLYTRKELKKVKAAANKA